VYAVSNNYGITFHDLEKTIHRYLKEKRNPNKYSKSGANLPNKFLIPIP